MTCRYLRVILADLALDDTICSVFAVEMLNVIALTQLWAFVTVVTVQIYLDIPN